MTAPRSLGWLRAAALLWIGSLAGFAIGIEWYRSRPPAPPPPSGHIDLVGAGATFPYPLYRRWFADYRAETGVRINYYSVGTGEGVRLLLDGEADFGAADRPLSAAERARARCGPVEIATAVGAVAVVVNLPRIASPVRLDPEVLAGIYLGGITRWDDPALRALNPALALPAMPIRLAHRGPTSGTGAVLAAYLDHSPAWRAARRGAAAPWAVGERIEGNEGVAAHVQANEGGLGFVELAYAQQNRLATAALRNAAGAFVRPDSFALARAAEELLAPAGADTLLALVGARGADAYPVGAVTRLVVDRALGDSTLAAHFIAFATWALRDGGASAAQLGYVPLPAPVRRRAHAQLAALVPGRCPTPRTD